MATHTNLLAASWLKPIIDLIQKQDFDEACALTEYLPDTRGKQLVRCGAVLGQKKTAEAEALLQKVSLRMPEELADFISIVKWSGVDFIELSLAAIRNKYFYLERLCLGYYLYKHLKLDRSFMESQTDEYQVIELFLENTLQQEPQRRSEIVTAYVILSLRAENLRQREKREKLLTKAIHLSTKFLFGEFFAREKDSDEYSSTEEVEPPIYVIYRAAPYERRLAFYALLHQQAKISTEKLTFWLEKLLQTDLDLTDKDIEQIQPRILQLPLELQNLIRQGRALQGQKDVTNLEVSIELPLFANESLESRSVKPKSSLPRPKFLPPRSGKPKRTEADSIRSSQAQSNLIKNLISAFDTSSVKPNEGAFDTSSAKLNKAEDSTVTVERYTLVDFPLQCALEREVKLRIQLVKDAPNVTRALKKITIPLTSGVEQAKLDVAVTAPGFKILQCYKQMILPVNGDSEEVTFMLLPAELGEQVIEIEFFHEGLRVGYVIVETRVGFSNTQKPAYVRSMEEPSDRVQALSNEIKCREQRTLLVNWDESGGKLYYRIYSNKNKAFEEGEQNFQVNKEQVENYLRTLNKFLLEIVQVALPTKEELKNLYSELATVGKSLFDLLIPPALKEGMQKWQPNSYIFVSTNEQWIPWELIHDGKDFWGKKFFIIRHPRINRINNQYKALEASRPISQGTRQMRRIVNVIGGQVENTAADQAAQLFNKLLPSLTVELLQKPPISVLESAASGADAVHYTCHGRLNPHMLQIAEDRDKEQNLLPEFVSKLQIEPGSLVFANACTSAVPVLLSGKFNSFAWEFYRQGADVFVGTLGAVPAQEAISFAETVYRELFRKDIKQTITQAVAIAKQEASEKGELFWLFYCIYGNPDFCINFS
ncbi:hypothetical protein NUACC21_49730 [Scytonema sp. NUACC21]